MKGTPAITGLHVENAVADLLRQSPCGMKAVRHVACPASHRPTTASAAARASRTSAAIQTADNAAGVGRRKCCAAATSSARIQREHAQPDAGETQRYDLLGPMVEARP